MSVKIDGKNDNSHGSTEKNETELKTKHTSEVNSRPSSSNKRKPSNKQSIDDWNDDTDSLFEELNKFEKRIEVKKDIQKIEIPIQSDTQSSDEHEPVPFTLFKLPQQNQQTSYNKSLKSFTKLGDTSVLSLPNEWIEQIESFEVQTRQFDTYVSLQQTIETDEWIKRLLEINEWSAGSIDETCIQYKTYQSSNHFLFLLKCCSLLGLDDDSLTSTRLNASAIYKLYKGELPWPNSQAQMKNDTQDLHQLIVKAFRCTVKFAIDCITLAPCSSDDEFFESMESYESQWYIGMENDKDYLNNIKDNRPFIFSLFYEPLKKIVNSRTLTLQKIRAPLAYLNSEVVKSIWSSTNLELLYMTNDDDERYSIQAHPFILRNLTIQASDPPLGYPIFKSEPLYVAI